MSNKQKEEKINKQNKKAFTLYELIIVILIIGILAGIGVSKISLNSNTKFIINVDDFFSKLLLTKQVALNYITYDLNQKNWTNKAICISLNNNKISSYITILNTQGDVIDKKYLIDEKGNKIENVSYTNVQINSPYNVICFDYEGRPFHDNLAAKNIIMKDFNITLSNNDIEKNITINGYTGNIFLN